MKLMDFSGKNARPLSYQNETPPICYTICQQPVAQPTMGGALEVHNEPTKSYRLN